MPGDGFGRMNVSRLLFGVSKVRNSFVGDICGPDSGTGARAFRGEFLEGAVEGVGTRVPARFANALGSIDLRRREPPRGTSEVSIA